MRRIALSHTCMRRREGNTSTVLLRHPAGVPHDRYPGSPRSASTVQQHLQKIRHIAPSLRLFVPNSITVHLLFFRSEVSSSWRLIVAVFSLLRRLYSNHSHCSLLKTDLPEQLPDKLRIGPGVVLSLLRVDMYKYFYMAEIAVFI
jgi:hypothetical protein